MKIDPLVSKKAKSDFVKLGIQHLHPEYEVLQKEIEEMKLLKQQMQREQQLAEDKRLIQIKKQQEARKREEKLKTLMEEEARLKEKNDRMPIYYQTRTKCETLRLDNERKSDICRTFNSSALQKMNNSLTSQLNKTIYFKPRVKGKL